MHRTIEALYKDGRIILQGEKPFAVRVPALLKEVFGFGAFWPLQEKIIAYILEKKDALVVMPTGGASPSAIRSPD